MFGLLPMFFGIVCAIHVTLTDERNNLTETFFKIVYKKHGNFAIDYVLPSNNDFGKTFTIDKCKFCGNSFDGLQTRDAFNKWRNGGCTIFICFSNQCAI